MLRNTRDDDQDAIRLRQRLRELNERAAKEIPIAPLKESGEEGLPVEQLYGPVVIEEDTKYWPKGYDPVPPPFELKGPSDLFLKDGRMVRNIYLLGEAAHGKTTYCMWLIKKWCNSYQRNGMSNGDLDEWEQALHQFDFVFLLEIGKLNQKRSNLTDLICDDEFGMDTSHHATIRRVLSTDTYRSLIIMDGIDEWRPNEDTQRRLSFKRIPNIEGISSMVSLIFLMRPWLLTALTRHISTSDRVLDMHGLSDEGLEMVIENILSHRYNLTKDSVRYKDAIRKLGGQVNDSLISFMRIPLIAVVCVQVWYERRQVGNGMTGFYAAILNMLIERAKQKHKLKMEIFKKVDTCVPEVLRGREHIENCISLFLKLGKVAYEGLLSNKTSLIFQKRKFENEIGLDEIQFCLHVGLISLKEAPSLLTRNIEIRFLHKSIQEFLAAIYIVSNKQVSISFCERLTDFGVIKEFSNLIGFLCGMYTSLGSRISKILESLTVSDAKFREFRESPLLDTNAVEDLFKIQVNWFRELQYGRPDSLIEFSVSDIYLCRYSNVEMVEVTKQFLSGYYTDIRSLWLSEVSMDKEHGVSDIELNNFLSSTEKTKSLVKLCIDGYSTDRSLHTICVPSLRYLYLSYVIVQQTGKFSQICLPLLSGMSELQWVKMYMVNLADSVLELSTNMVCIEMVELESVSMSASGWETFLQSLLNIQHEFVVVLWNTNIDDELLELIRSSPYFNVTDDDAGMSGQCKISFARVWPMTQVT